MIIALLLVIFILIFWGKIFGPGDTPVIKDKNGNIIPGSIATLEEITLGGIKQAILIRGYDQDNPILLWLHGGPGSSQMPIAHHYDKELEKAFTIVHWDQRGAGKSNPTDFEPNTMTYAQFIADGHQLTGYLKNRFAKERIYLLGHSWGTQLGLELAGRYPEDYYGYIGVSQIINQQIAEKITYPWLLEQIKEKENKKDLEQLSALGKPPYFKHTDFVTFIKMVDAYGGGFDLPFFSLLWISLYAPEYNLWDYFAWLDGSNRGSGKMWQDEDYSSFNAIERFSELDLPVVFFVGKQDYNTPLEATQRYYQKLVAPKGKQLIVFQDSSHTPFLAEPEKFVQELIKIKNKTFF